MGTCLYILSGQVTGVWCQSCFQFLIMLYPQLFPGMIQEGNGARKMVRKEGSWPGMALWVYTEVSTSHPCPVYILRIHLRVVLILVDVVQKSVFSKFKNLVLLMSLHVEDKVALWSLFFPNTFKRVLKSNWDLWPCSTGSPFIY